MRDRRLPAPRTRRALALAAFTLLPAGPALGQAATADLTYPQTQRGDLIEDYHGTSVLAPYRWLEDSDSPDVGDWVNAQNDVTFAYLESLPYREEIETRLTELWDYERFGTPWKEGGRYFFFKNDGLQNQSVLYVQESLEDEPRVLVDPNGLSEDGTVALAGSFVSPDGRYLAYSLNTSGSDWREFKLRDIETGEDLPDHLEWAKFTGASWTKDSQGFFYARYPAAEEGSDRLTEANSNQMIYYHRVGTPQAEDVLVHADRSNPQWLFGAGTTEDGRFLILTVREGSSSSNRLWIRDLGDPMAPDLDGPLLRLMDDNDARYSVVHNGGPVFYIRTDLDAPRGRLIEVDLRKPGKHLWRTIIPESEDLLESVTPVGGRFLARYLHDAHGRVAAYEMDGTPAGDLDLPTIGSVGGLSGDEEDTELFYSFSSFLYPTTIFRHDLATGATEVFKAPDVDFDPSGYVTKQVFYESKDGTQVPMFITHRAELALDGQNPSYLYGYGGFNISLRPSFSLSNLVWLEMGGVYAQPTLRGGGEYGEEWHQAGTKERKQNVFDDFIAAAEYLIDEGYTRSDKLAIGGGSNGGLLVGAAMTQRPELFAAALPAVGVMDMLRFHKFTIGWAWVSDYGSSDDPEGFDYLRAYSPLHNLTAGVCYPATLVTTADHDDRVVPAHSFKFAAQLQAAQGCGNPAVIRIETKAGHGAGKPTSKRIEEAADKWAFALANMSANPILP
ncbi:MAG: prolyl oligopeptidase family serine peptidase [Gemmatimonadota bacterium]